MTCTSQPKRAMPSVLLSEPQMVEVMTDVQIVESAISYKRSVKGQTEYLKTRGYDTIFAHYGITDSLFKENFEYYIESPDVMERIMDSVISRLEAMKTKTETARPVEVKPNR